MRIKLTVTLLLISIATILYANNPPEGLRDKELREWFKKSFYDSKRVYLNYNEARVFMYGFIDNKQSFIECVYSGYELILPYGTKTTFPDPINCEHTIPQSFFKNALDKEMMKTDLHHLYPVLKRWNSTRSNNPYSDIDDENTVKWMIDDTFLKNKRPTKDIDKYSEYFNKMFEPREEHKGNVARAIFYFYTVYEGDMISPIETLIDPDTLYSWHILDPVDEDELARNSMIELYQGNRNPYIDYPDLAVEAFNLD